MLLFAKNCFVSERFVSATVSVSGDKIVSVDLCDNPPAGCDYVFSDGYLVPGLIDVQINGASGVDFSNAESKEISLALAALSSIGTTSICPTVITSAVEGIRRQLELLDTIPGGDSKARNLGTHLEGPCLASSHRGAHDPKLLASPADISKSVDFSKVKIFTLAPELEGSSDLIAQATSAGALVSLGHSNATFSQAQTAVSSGARMVTHLFNGMRGLHHREPGLVGAALANPALSFGVIVDGEHVSYPVLEIVFALAADRAIVVSDASAALMAKPGAKVELGGSELLVDEKGSARRPDGTLASSGLTQLQAIEKAVIAGLNRETLISSATRAPAELLGYKDLGIISEGALADLVHYTVGEHVTVDFVSVGGQICQLS